MTTCRAEHRPSVDDILMSEALITLTNSQNQIKENCDSEHTDLYLHQKDLFRDHYSLISIREKMTESIFGFVEARKNSGGRNTDLSDDRPSVSDDKPSISDDVQTITIFNHFIRGDSKDSVGVYFGSENSFDLVEPPNRKIKKMSQEIPSNSNILLLVPPGRSLIKKSSFCPARN